MEKKQKVFSRFSFPCYLYNKIVFYFQRSFFLGFRRTTLLDPSTNTKIFIPSRGPDPVTVIPNSNATNASCYVLHKEDSYHNETTDIVLQRRKCGSTEANNETVLGICQHEECLTVDDMPCALPFR